MPATSITGWVLVVSASVSLGPSLIRRPRSSSRASEASFRTAATAGWSPQASSMPTACEPWPGNTKANGFMLCLSNAMVVAEAARASEVQQDRAPGEAAAHAFEHERVALLDLALAHRDVQRQRDRGGGGV